MLRQLRPAGAPSPAPGCTAMLGEVSQNLENEKNSEEFFEVREVSQNLENEKNSEEFFEVREVSQNLENEKNSEEFFEVSRPAPGTPGTVYQFSGNSREKNVQEKDPGKYRHNAGSAGS